MNHLSSRVISLVLAVIFLFSAAGISFATLFRGTTVYAEEGDTAGTTTQVESQAPKEEPDAVLSSSRAGSRMLAAANEPKTGEGTDTGDKNDEQDPSPNEYSIQGVEFWLGGERKQEVSSGQTVDRMVITIVDTRFSYKDYKDLSGGEGDSDEVRNKNFFASLNSENFKSESEPSFVFKEGKKDSVYYTVTYASVRYTGESKTLRLSVSYPPEWGIGMTDFSKELNELKVKSPSSEREHNKNDDDDDDSSSRPDIAPPTPTLIVSEFDYGGASVAAASDFSLKLRFTNTSKKLPIDNIVIKITVPEAFTLKGSSNTIYLEKMSRESSIERTIALSVKPGAEPISHAIKLDFAYEAVIDEARKQLTSEQEISIPVTQLDRFTLNPVEVPSELYVGDDTSIEVSFVNKGKSPIYNVSAEIAGNIAQPGQRQFIGNIEAGKEDSADFQLGALEGGEVKGEIIITYEDANMHVTEIREPFTTTAISFSMPSDDGMDAMNPMDEVPEETPWYQTIPVWGWMVGGVVLMIFAAFLIRLMLARRKEDEAFLEDDDEDI
ncbi:hypothetical protein D4A47_07230 [Anaerotruncus massiliensis (ex Liu et al. 2021)]|uniref:CARDB domain-containing protein n=3 Tax=Anaerotruncus TaxID=244127 RepID=A0A498CQH1_9FIRM|nr:MULTISPECIES: hypothetical protein [Anaerotruncus]MBC3938715.1 hypothetical protein [Anaerotruncus massiliensis (ex Togo et al. 2019)]RLL11406.1 hypothetical protein D4A47_07230 [Anaerotruncus massiliensis (ex Liu et al. 2021)]